MENVRHVFETSSSEHNQLAIRNQDSTDPIFYDREYEGKVLLLDPLVRQHLVMPAQDEYSGYRFSDLKTKANVLWNLIVENIWPYLDEHQYLDNFYQVMSDNGVTVALPARWSTNLAKYIMGNYTFDFIDGFVIDSVQADLIPIVIHIDALLGDRKLIQQFLFDTRSFVHFGEVNAYFPIDDPNYEVVMF